MHTTSRPRGFTLIELIVTIAIVAILVTVLVVAINPAEQLSRSRDSKRISDLDALKTALNLYLAQATTTINLSGNTPSANSGCIFQASSTLYLNTTGAVATSTVFGASTTIVRSTTTQAVGSTGWMPARIDQTPGGATVSVLPLDPTNGLGSGTTYFYYYLCDITGGVRNFELGATLESTYFTSDLDLDGTDGGNESGRYEVGTDPALNL
ncbi:type II secretion system protein [Candidatus Jorgensenbacteria bacterium]|nr:type II secretion system protein [Candidatus Jorgensenbacteria bacterium]